MEHNETCAVCMREIEVEDQLAVTNFSGVYYYHKVCNMVRERIVEKTYEETEELRRACLDFYHNYGVLSDDNHRYVSRLMNAVRTTFGKKTECIDVPKR